MKIVTENVNVAVVGSAIISLETAWRAASANLRGTNVKASTSDISLYNS